MKIFPETVFQTLLGLMTGLESEYFPMIIIVLLRFTGLIVVKSLSPVKNKILTFLELLI